MNEHPEHPIDEEAVSRGHEVRETNISLVVKFGVGLAVLTIGSMLLMWVMFIIIDRYQTDLIPEPEPLVETNQLPPEPRLQVIPEEDLAKLRAAEQEHLETYGWTIRTAEIVRIPVDRAMDLSLERAQDMFPIRPQGDTGAIR